RAARADRLPDGEADRVVDELHVPVGEADVHAARMVAAGGDVGLRKVGGRVGGRATVAAVVALVVGRHRVGVVGRLGQALVLLAARVPDDAGRRVIPGVAAVRRRPGDEGAGAGGFGLVLGPGHGGKGAPARVGRREEVDGRRVVIARVALRGPLRFREQG